MKLHKITPCLWFDGKAEEAAKFYTSIFPNSKILDTLKYGETGQEITGGKPGSVLTVTFEIEGQKFVALNGGPLFKFSEAISFIIDCKDQAEVDYFWEKLLADGGQESQCGWLKDKFGVSWQVTPEILDRYIADPDKEKSERVMAAMLKMVKIDVAAIQRAYDGK